MARFKNQKGEPPSTRYTIPPTDKNIYEWSNKSTGGIL